MNLATHWAGDKLWNLVRQACVCISDRMVRALLFLRHFVILKVFKIKYFGVWKVVLCQFLTILNKAFFIPEAGCCGTPLPKSYLEFDWGWKFQLDPFIPSKVIQLSLPDRWTQMLALMYRLAIFNAFFDTLYISTFALLAQFVKGNLPS